MRTSLAEFKSSMLFIRCLSFDDLIKVLVSYGIVSRRKPTSSMTWSPLEPGVYEALTAMKQQSDQELAELTLLYDPEDTGVIGMSDFYLLLKDLFINSRDLVLQLAGQPENIFEAEGSYKELMAKLDSFMFDEIGLCRKMYQKSKNVSIDFKMFWSVVGSLLQTGILELKVDKSPKRQFTSELEDNFEARAKKMMEKIKLIEIEEPDDHHLETETNRSHPDPNEAVNRRQNNLFINPDINRCSKSQPPENRKKFEMPAEIARHLAKNNRQNSSLNNSIVRLDSSKNAPKDNSFTENNSNRKIQCMESEKHGQDRDDSSDLFKDLRSEFQADVLKGIDEHSQKSEINPKFKKSKIINDCPTHQSKLNGMLLKQSEGIWKKALTEIFCFYNMLQKQAKSEYSFDNFKVRMNYMSLGEWIKFCSDFGLAVYVAEHQRMDNNHGSMVEYNRRVLSQIFKREAKGGVGISFMSFQVKLVSIRLYLLNCALK